MFKNKILFEKIISQLIRFEREIEIKVQSNLLDDNMFSEDFIRDFLNVCMGWDLLNLNRNTKNYPGIDLGGLQNEIDIIIDGNNLFDRLVKLEIDEDILYKQLSLINLQKVIENCIFRKSKKCKIVFVKNSRHYDEKAIYRLESEGTKVVILEDNTQVIEFVSEQIKKNLDLVLVSSNENLMNTVSLKNDECFLYTVTFEEDLPIHGASKFFAKGDITSMRLNNCFNYAEGRYADINNITEEIYRDMLANANDCFSHQLRDDRSGRVYISTITGSEEIDSVKFVWESWDPGNEYVGPRAASNYEYVKKSVDSLKKCWEDGVIGYCDYYATM